MHKDYAVSRAINRRPTPTSEYDSHFSDNNDGGGYIPENNRGKSSQPILKNKKNKK